MDEKKIERLKQAGFIREAERAELGFCPFCGKPVTRDEFRDALSLKEFEISGLCQVDQDKFFGRDA